ncbi:MAG: energy-coupling factor ABC transporter permease [Candidatus Competibacteraceae bacterium]
MNIPSHLLPPDWLFFADVVGAVVLWQAIRYAPWRQLRAAGLQQLFAGSVVALLLLWNLSAALKPGLGFHFLGVTVFTLMFGWSFGVLGVGLAALGLALKGGGLAVLALNALIFGVLPVSVSYLVYQWVDRRLPHHIFIYIYLCAFLGAMLAAGCAVLAMVGLLVANNVYSFDEIARSYLPFLPLFLFPEGFLNGMLITVFIGIRPHWLKTFDDESYLNR